MKVLFLTNVPSPYRVDFFNELGKYCDLTVLFEKNTSAERDKSWKNYEFKSFSGVFLKGFSVSTDTAICLGVIKYIKNGQFDIIVCCNFSSPTGILAIAKMKQKKIPYYLEADGGTAKSGKTFKEWLKKIIISNANGYFSTSESCDEYFLTYGADKNKIYRYPFTSLKNEDILNSPLLSPEKHNLRKKLGMTEERIIISVGRFSYQNGYGKGYDTLLQVCEKLPREIGVYIIGDKPTKEFLNWKERKCLNSLHFIPFKLKRDLFDYYKAADLSVLLSRGEAWGLVINESMANGTPVIATNACVGALEIIKNRENGYLVPVNSPQEVLSCISEFLSDEDFQKNMSFSAIQEIKNYTIESMVNAHRNYFDKILNSTL